MESSSESSFVWSDASSDSIYKMSPKKEEGGEDSESGKSYKKRLHDQLFQNNLSMLNDSHKEYQATEYVKKIDHIKSEPDSDIDRLEKKRKKKKKKSVSQDSSNDETYLKCRMKEENSSLNKNFTVIENKLKKSRKELNLCLKKETQDHLPEESYLQSRVKSENVSLDISNMQNVTCDTESTFTLQGESEVETSHLMKKKKHKKKKVNDIPENMEINVNIKKEFDNDDVNKVNSKKRKVKELENDYSETLIEKCSAGETVIEPPRKKAKKSRSTENISSINDTSNYSYSQNASNMSKNISPITNFDQKSNRNAKSDFYENKNKSSYSPRKELKTSSLRMSNEVYHEPYSVTQHLSKMSDHIMFEDETKTIKSGHKTKQFETNSSDIMTPLIKKFLDENMHLKVINMKSYESLGISKNDDLWLLQFPENDDVELDSLKDVKLSLKRKSKININGCLYEGNSSENNECLYMIQSNNVCNEIKLNGIINYKLRSSEGMSYHDKGIEFESDYNISRCTPRHQHPLFESIYQKSSVLSTSESSEPKCEETPVKEGKKRKKHKKNKESE